MKWIRERDELIAQTLAFVQSVTGRKDHFPPPEAPAAAPGVSLETVAVEAAAVQIEPPRAAPQPQPAQVVQVAQVAPPRTGGDFRTEMQARIANFRKHQERFEREREEYCAATLTKVRAAIRDAAPPPPASK
jgi:hypothetical protein